MVKIFKFYFTHSARSWFTRGGLPAGIRW